MSVDSGQDLFDGDIYQSPFGEEDDEDARDSDFLEFSPSPSHPLPQSRRQRRPIWPYYVLAAGGGLLVGGILTWLIIQLVYGGGLFARTPPPEETLAAYYRALEQQDFEAAVAYMDPTAPKVKDLETMAAVVNWIRQELFQSLSRFLGATLRDLLLELSPDLSEERVEQLESMDTDLQLEFSNLVYTPVVVNREVAVIDVEFDVRVGFGEMLFPAGSVRRRHTLRWYQEQWLVEP